MIASLRVLFLTGAAGLAGGVPVFAREDGGEAAASGIAWYTWVLILFCVITAIMTILYWTRRKKPKGRFLKGAALLAGTFAVLMGAFNSAGMWLEKEKTAPINLIHIHGLSYAQDGGSIMLATHDGIKHYKDGSWTAGSGEHHDYVGFTPYEGGFYSSGHPVSGSKLQNPLGLVKSSDNGLTLELLGLQGLVDFRLLAVSYKNPAIYGYNSEPNEGLKQIGLYQTKDEGKTWSKCGMLGFMGEPTTLAVHPDNGSMVAVGSRDGLFLSRDEGKTFEKLLPDTGISALSFDHDGMLAVGGFKDKPSLVLLDPVSMKPQEVPLPDLKEDAVAYTAHHPSKPQERIITTYNQDVFLTADGGETWSQLADSGKIKINPEILPKAIKKS